MFLDQSTALMITIPVRKLEPFIKKSNDTTLYADLDKTNLTTEASFTNLDSDVYIVHSSDLISLFRLKLASKGVSFCLRTKLNPLFSKRHISDNYFLLPIRMDSPEMFSQNY